jgi:hypothetical protein
MARRSLRIVNESRRTSAADAQRVRAIEQAIRIQLRHVAAAWGQYVWEVVDDANRFGFKIALLDDADVADALGYHDLGPDGLPYARVFLDPIFDNGGTWLRGANSVAVVASHEACEMVGDPSANHWTEKPRGSLVAQELCDPVESNAYRVTIAGGRQVSVSNFVYPDWFNPFAPPGTKLDHLGVVDQPFGIAPGGYVIYRTPSGIRNLYGMRYPRWRRTTKTRGSRTFARRRAAS